MNPRSVRLAVVDYGVGNLRSAEKAFQHLGVEARLTASIADIRAADGVVVPGVGSFAGCIEALDDSGLTDVVRDAAIGASHRQSVPFLGICVGLQLLHEGSEENPDRVGLGVFPGRVRALDESVKSPQMQWNRLGIADPGDAFFVGLGDEPWMYFVHSYAAPISTATVAVCEYGGPVSAAERVGNLMATQFHPEKSGRGGLQLLRNFATICAEVTKGIDARC